MRRVIWLATVGMIGAGLGAGCDNSPPPARVEVPSRQQSARTWDRDEIKPLPPQDDGSELPPPPFEDVPLVNQRPPEERAYVDAYGRVGRPRMLVFVNRTLEGEVMPVNAEEPVARVEHHVSSTGGVDVESHTTRSHSSYYRDSTHEDSSKFRSNGPGQFHETSEVYLHPGQYDEAQAKALDYGAIENILTDWLSAGGRVAIVSPTMARQRLSDDQVKDLQSGRPRVLGEVARLLDADVLVQIQAHPTRQTSGLEVRIIAEAVNVKGGESIARAVVDVAPPLDKPQINKYTRFLARKLMVGLIGSWESFGGGPAETRRPRPDADRDAPPPGPRVPSERREDVVPVLPEPRTQPSPRPDDPTQGPEKPAPGQ